MDEALIELNGQEITRPCSGALEPADPSLVGRRTEMIYDLVQASPKEYRFVFTSNGAEAVNQVLFSAFLEVARKEGKCHFITSCIEDIPTLQMMKRLEELGCFVKIAPVNEKGEIDLAQLEAMINPRTALISVTMAQGLTGVIQPVEAIAQMAKERGILLHLEGSYAVGKYYVSLGDLGADYLTFSGHLLHSVVGSGALFAKEKAPLVPLIVGGGSFRGGLLDERSLLSLGAAAQGANLYLDNMSLEVARLRDLFEKEVQAAVPDAEVLFSEALRLPTTTAILFPEVHQEALLYFLRHRVKASIGGKYAPHLSRLLEASRVENPACALSFSLTRMTTESEVRRAAREVGEAVAMLKTMSHGVFHAVH